MPRLQKIVKGRRYQVGRFAGQWYVADLDANRFVYGPFLRRETAEARIKKVIHMSKRNPISRKSAGKQLSYDQRKFSTPRFLNSNSRKQINNLIKQGWEFDYTFLYPSGKINHHLVNDGRTAILHEDGTIEMLYPVGTSVFDVLKKRNVTQGYGSEPNPEWKPPFAQRKRKRLGELYAKAFSKFTKENPKRKGVLIYGRVLKIFAQKTDGPYKGQQFVHTFKRGAIMVGMPDGSLRILHPG